MDQAAQRAALIKWLHTQNYTIFTTLAFNTKTSHNVAKQRLCELHARLDRLALGPRWQKLHSSRRTSSISFVENVQTNLHFHMLWSAPKSERILLQALPSVWQELAPAGDAYTRFINGPDALFDYCTKQIYQHDYILDGRT